MLNVPRTILSLTPRFRACHYAHLQGVLRRTDAEALRRRVPLSWSAVAKPHRGDLFIASGPHVIFFLFFGGAAARSTSWLSPVPRRAAEKQKEKRGGCGPASTMLNVPRRILSLTPRFSPIHAVARGRCLRCAGVYI